MGPNKVFSNKETDGLEVIDAELKREHTELKRMPSSSGVQNFSDKK